MKDKFMDTPAGEKWRKFKRTPSVDNGRELMAAMTELDKSRADQELEM